MKYLKTFLLKNGFKQVSHSVREFKNDKCSIYIEGDDYISIEYDEDTYYVDSLNLYHLIGFLTYQGLMDKNYIQ